MNRRHLLATVPAFALAACGTVTTTTANKVTTVSIDVAKLTGWADAISVAADGILSVLQGVPQAAAAAAMVTSVKGLVIADVDAINRASGGQTKLVFDASSPPAAVLSLLSNAREILTDMNGVQLPGNAAKQVAPYLLAIEAIATALQAELAPPKA
jgi:hypothetical protein